MQPNVFKRCGYMFACPLLQFKRDAVAAESGADRQVASLQEQRRLLEEQATTLQRQVDGLVQVGLGWSSTSAGRNAM